MTLCGQTGGNMKNPRKGPFDLNIDLEQIPSYQTRFKSLDSMGSSISMAKPKQVIKETPDLNLREKIGSGQDPRSLPSVILRRKGIRV